jgi:hypothetical protein
MFYVTQEKKKRGGVRKKSSGTAKKPRRSDFDYPYLEPSVALLKRRDEVIDVASYANQLTPDEKAWMNQFMKEYNDADTATAVFHTDAKTRKICNDRNNARNRCWYTEEAAANRLNLVESDYEMERLIYSTDPSTSEDEPS